MGSANNVRVKLRPTISLLLGICWICIGAGAASAGDVTLLGNERIVFSTLFGDSSGVTYNNGSCWIPRRAMGSNYDVDNEPYFDGPIAPITYSEGGVTKLRFNASLGYRNYEILSTLSGFGESVTFSNGSLVCDPVYTASLDSANDSFAWGEWLYGTFRDVGSGKVYSAIYNEYYGGYYPGRDSYSTYVATGLAVSYDNGKSFAKIQTAPNHVILRLASLRQNTTDAQGLSWFGGIFKSPVDQLYYMGANDYYSGATAMVRTGNLDDPTSWRAWNGSDWSVPTAPLTQPFQGIGVNPLYLGYSDYFKKYIAVTIGDDAYGENLIVYNLSDDLVHWGPARKLMFNPLCGSSHVCGSNPSALSAYPSIMDPVYLSDVGNSTNASNGMIGAHPYVTYIKGFTPPAQHRQEFAVQQVSFDQVPTNRLDNFSVRAVAGVGKPIVMGFILQGTEAKQILFRGLGPSLPDLGYGKYLRPAIALYNSAGTLVASNDGWRTGPDQQYLIDTGLNPGSDNESAFLATLPPDSYTIQINGNCLECGPGMALIEAYDLSSTAESTIANVSIRAYGQPGNGAIIMGFLSRGGQTAVVRGTGTSTLAPYGFSPVIPNPYISVSKDGNSVIANDNWGDPPNGTVIQNYGLAPGDSLESATVFPTEVVLPARYSGYSVVLQGTGFGLLEVYNVETR